MYSQRKAQRSHTDSLQMCVPQDCLDTEPFLEHAVSIMLLPGLRCPLWEIIGGACNEAAILWHPLCKTCLSLSISAARVSLPWNPAKRELCTTLCDNVANGGGGFAARQWKWHWLSHFSGTVTSKEINRNEGESIQGLWNCKYLISRGVWNASLVVSDCC